MRRNLIVLGSSGLAKEIAQVAEQVNAHTHAWNFLGFISESSSDAGKSLGTGKILGNDEWLLQDDLKSDLIIGVGYPKVKAAILERYLNNGDRFAFPNLVHPGAYLDSSRVELGRGNVITAGCNFTCDISVGDFNLFNLNMTVGHDVRIGDLNVCNPSVNISGDVHLGSRILVGTGCQILEHLKLGDDATLGAGCVVAKNVAHGVTVTGIPARPVQ